MAFLVYLAILSNVINCMDWLDQELFNDIEKELSNSHIRDFSPLQLAPDDIASVTRWTQLEPKVPENFGMYIAPIKIDRNSPFSDFYTQKKDIIELPEYEIRSRHRYVPSFIKNTREMTAIVVHGTWGRFSEFCRENNNPEGKNDPQKQSFRHMKRFVSELSTYFGQAAEIISFGWSGERSHRARDEGGVFLAEYLNRAYKHTDRIFIGHSHGNNLINAATNEDSMQNNPAKLLIYFACPQRPEKQYRPKHFNQLIYFLSHDPIDRGGSVPEGWPQFMAGAILGGSAWWFSRIFCCS